MAVTAMVCLVSTATLGASQSAAAPSGIQPPPAEHSIGDLVFQDRNRDGLQAGGDPGMPGIDSTIAAGPTSATSDASGAYIHDGYSDGSYTVVFDAAQVASLGLEFTTAEAGDDALDSDADPVTGAAPAVVSGADVTDVDAGVRLVAPAQLVCADGNPRWDNNGDLAAIGDLPGSVWDVRLVPSGGSPVVEVAIPIDTTALVAGVEIDITSVSADLYWLRAGQAAQPNEQWRVLFNQGGATVHTSGFTTDVPDGVFSASVSDNLGTIVLSDDIDEVVIQHWSVENASTDFNSVVPVSLCLATVEPPPSGLVVEKITEGGTGTFDFTLAPTNDLGDVATFDLTTTAEGPSGAVDTGADHVPIDAGEYIATEDVPDGWELSDIKCDVAAVANLTSGAVTFTVPAGTIVRCTFTNTAVELPTGAIGDFVWEDTNRDGIQDSGEPPVEAVKVDLLQDGVVVATTVTDADGLYLFDGLPAGDYQVQFHAPDEFTGFTLADQTVAAAASDPDAVDSDADVATGLTHIIELDAGEIDLTIDAGVVRAIAQVRGQPPTEPLAFTGAETFWIALSGAFVLLVGLSLVDSGRRRKHPWR